MNSTGARYEWASGAAGAMMGLGILTFALFPFALPLLILTIAGALPFILPLVAFAVLAAILRGTWLGIRAAGRGIRRLTASPTRRSHPRVAILPWSRQQVSRSRGLGRH